jgi:pilus assembly protein Flp/PilA
MTARFLADESGATAIEYALIGAVVSVCIAISLTRISGSLQSVFNGVGSSIGSNLSK